MSGRVRSYETRDFDAVLALVETTLREFGFGDNVGGARRDLENIATGYGGPRAGFWIAEDDDAKVCGTIAIRPKDDARVSTCELKRLYVSGAMRGRGVGAALYAHAEAFARDAGYARIWLDSSRKFTAARKLYEKMDSFCSKRSKTIGATTSTKRDSSSACAISKSS